MRLTITHKTIYHYDDDVFLEPHTFRLAIRQDPHVTVHRRSLEVLPEPAGLTEHIGLDGAPGALAWFEGYTNKLEVVAATEVSLQEFNPFYFLIYPPGCLRLPMNYPAALLPALQMYRKEGIDAKIHAFARDIAAACDFRTMLFLTRLCEVIFTEFVYLKREHGEAFSATETLARKEGSCRDFVVLAMEACQSLGLACRYVSGYYLSEDPQEPSELHAWLEVYVPGAGWMGFDPTHGLVCTHYHLALCSAPDPNLTYPVAGTFRGKARSRMFNDLEIAWQDSCASREV